MADPGQAATIHLAAHLEACLEPARRAFARLCPELCPACQNTCCLRISPHGLLDQVDLIYFAALGLHHLPYPRPRERGCPFLEAEGCLLPWRARPYACLHYICAPMQDTLGRREFQEVWQALDRAGQMRAELHAAFVDLP